MNFFCEEYLNVKHQFFRCYTTILWARKDTILSKLENMQMCYWMYKDLLNNHFLVWFSWYRYLMISNYGKKWLLLMIVIPIFISCWRKRNLWQYFDKDNITFRLYHDTRIPTVLCRKLRMHLVLLCSDRASKMSQIYIILTSCA